MTKKIHPKILQNDKEYWEKQYANPLEHYIKLAQAAFFYKYFRKLIPDELLKETIDKTYTCCDFGCGLGLFANNLYEIFPNFKLYGVDYSSNAISFAKKNFPKVSFINTDLDNLKQDFDIIISSNTLEHFYNPEDVLQKLTTHATKFLFIMVPYEERELCKEHLFTFERNFFNKPINNFEPLYLRAIDLSCIFNTMYLGKQILAIYKHKDIKIDFAYTENLETTKYGTIDKINYNINIVRRSIYREIIKKYLIKK